jgi:uncharacterized C2H2 Zn-finger protein
MRSDMHHLLVERGHAGRSWSYKRPKGWRQKCRFRNEDDEQAESNLPLRHRPSFSENLNPLYRYLDAQVGRPWDKVYSEIRAHVNADTAVQYHILQHLYDRLAVQVWREADGELWCRFRWGKATRLTDRWGPTLYVCPDTGLLRRVKRKVKRHVSNPPDHLPASGPDHEYRDLNGQWFEVWWGKVMQGGTVVRAITRKRQLSYKELRDLGLRD